MLLMLLRKEKKNMLLQEQDNQIQLVVSLSRNIALNIKTIYFKK